MIGFGGPIWIHLLLWMLMISLLASVRMGNLRENRLRRRDERLRLRVALIAELRALRAAYRINAGLAAEPRAALSGRPFFAMFRGNMGRLLLLSEGEVAAMVRCHAASEALDEAMMLRARVGKQRGQATEAVRVADLDLRRLQRAARGNCRIALEVLLAAADADAAHLPWYQRWMARLRAWLGRPAASPAAAPPPPAEIIRLPPPGARAAAGRRAADGAPY